MTCMEQVMQDRVKLTVQCDLRPKRAQQIKPSRGKKQEAMMCYTKTRPKRPR